MLLDVVTLIAVFKGFNKTNIKPNVVVLLNFLKVK
jgi:hypothetical protein